MTKSQKKLAAEAVCEIVRNACDTANKRPSDADLKRLAKSAAKAIAAGFSALKSAT